MKSNVHTDVLMRAVLNSKTDLRTAGRGCSHVFGVDVPGHERLIGITDAAINITPDLAAKGEICRSAIDLFHTLGVPEPRVAVLSAVETVTGGIASKFDAACLTLMAQRGQIIGAQVDGPLAFDKRRFRQRRCRKGHPVGCGWSGGYPSGAGPGVGQHSAQGAAISRWRGWPVGPN